MPRYRRNSAELQAAARAMRRQPTLAEDRLWQALRGGVLGVRFRRQHPVGHFILDFWCPAARLVVEVDGDVHDMQPERDAARTEVLASFNCHVIRFRNDEVLRDLDTMLQRIHAEVGARTNVPPSPGSSGEGAGG
jgi:very-short-patch-repair endonuclease